MTCFYCKAEMESGFTTHFAEIGNCVVIIKNVPCQKCPQCGEVVYTGDVVQRIEEIIERYKDAAEVAIVNYKAA